MSCPCANYYVSFHTWLEVQSTNREEGSIKCPNWVQIFGGYCDIYMIACTGIPMKNLLPHASSPMSDVKTMSGTFWGNKAAANPLLEAQLCYSSIRLDTLLTDLDESGL
ncbi:hypothetical protein QL093DRAFT_2118266 [Fusarium oxysporum]|nr:hypothetical protein QL093DRAFT_2118266 [Fusarium oxysporum]